MADITRLEQFLNHIAHPEDPIPAPQTRLEQNLVEIAENKGGGGDGGVLLVGTDMQTMALNHTWQEIYDAMASGKAVFVTQSMEDVPSMGDVATVAPIVLAMGPVPQTGGGDAYVVIGITVDMSSSSVPAVGLKFGTTSADGYPTQIMGG